MRVWQNTEMTRDMFAFILSKTLCRKETLATESGLANPVNETKLNYLLQLYQDDVRELGNTAWTAYNALTHWSTHTDHQITTDEGKTIPVSLYTSPSPRDGLLSRMPSSA